VFERDEASAHCESRQAGDVVDVEPLHQQSAVRLDSLAAEIETVANFLCGLPFGD
jgi:hypothetical protein